MIYFIEFSSYAQKVIKIEIKINCRYSYFLKLPSYS